MYGGVTSSSAEIVAQVRRRSCCTQPYTPDALSSRRLHRPSIVHRKGTAGLSFRARILATIGVRRQRMLLVRCHRFGRPHDYIAQHVLPAKASTARYAGLKACRLDYRGLISVGTGVPDAAQFIRGKHAVAGCAGRWTFEPGHRRGFDIAASIAPIEERPEIDEGVAADCRAINNPSRIGTISEGLMVFSLSFGLSEVLIE